MRIQEIIRGAIPDAEDILCEHILWERTAYPFKKLSAQDIYKAASRFKRAHDNAIELCDFCDNIAIPDAYLCQRCRAAIDNAKKKT